MPLKVPVKIKPQTTTPSEYIEEDEVISAAHETLKRLRLRLPARPKADDGTDLDPVYPTDLSDISSDHLGQLLGDFVRMAEYAGVQLALLDTRQTATRLNEKMATTIGTLRADGPVKEREAKGVVHAKTRAFMHLQRLAEYKILSAVYEGFVEKRKSISREISRRLQREEKEP